MSALKRKRGVPSASRGGEPPAAAILQHEDSDNEHGGAKLAKILNKAVQDGRKKAGPVGPKIRSSSQPSKASNGSGRLTKPNKSDPTTDIYDGPVDDDGGAVTFPGQNARQSRMNATARQPSASKQIQPNTTLRPRKNQESEPEPANGPADLGAAAAGGDEVEAGDIIPDANNIAEPGGTVEVEDVENGTSQRQSLPKYIEQSPRTIKAAHSYIDGSDPSIPHRWKDQLDTIELDVTNLEGFNTMKDLLKGVYRLQDGQSDREPKQVVKFQEHLSSMTESYLALRAARIARRPRATKIALERVRKSVGQVTAMVPKLKLNSTRKLANVYLDFIPKFIDAISIGVDAYTFQEPITTASIGEIANLLLLVFNMATEAVCQSDEIQPRTEYGACSVRRPTMEILPIIEATHKAFMAELRTRQEAQDHVDREFIAELERRRQEKESEIAQISERRQLEKEIERRSRMNNLHKLQRQALDAKLADPLLVQWIMTEVARGNIKSESWGKESTHRTHSPDVNRSSHPLATLDYGEVSHNDLQTSNQTEQATASNRREEYRSSRWSNEAKIIFIETMRTERGNDRYATAAERLGWTMDDVFECARDLQQAMDVEHENGNMNEPCDEWTYNIWVERE